LNHGKVRFLVGIRMMDFFKDVAHGG
jgi:hypothetical protein